MNSWCWKSRKREKPNTTPQCGKHCLKPGCGSSCKKKCSPKIPEEMRDKINREFWTMSHFQRQCFMLHATQRKLADRKTAGSDSRRKHSYYYFLDSIDDKNSVCKTFFLTTLGFQKNNDTALQNCLKSMSLDSMKPGADRRGKTKLLLITNRKLHMRFRLAPRSMTFYDHELL